MLIFSSFSIVTPFTLLLLLCLLFQPVRTETSATCSVTGKEPNQPSGAIRFCHMFNSNTCCDPAIDTEIQGYYNDMIGKIYDPALHTLNF